MNVIVTTNGQTYAIPLIEAIAFCNRQSIHTENYIIKNNDKIYIPKQEAKELHKQIHDEVYR